MGSALGVPARVGAALVIAHAAGIIRCDLKPANVMLTEARLPGLRVIARAPAFAFRGKNVDIREIGANLKAATILEGSVRKDGSRIRVTALLIKTADQSHLRSDRYDRVMTYRLPLRLFAEPS
jgi:TolB-like protein